MTIDLDVDVDLFFGKRDLMSDLMFLRLGGLGFLAEKNDNEILAQTASYRMSTDVSRAG